MRNVLLVENDGLIRQIIKDDLTEHGFSVAEAADGLAALEAIRTTVPDCVITDMILPKIEGYRLIQYLRGNVRYRHIPLVVVSEIHPEVFIQHLGRLDVDAYVVKGPLTVMLESLRKALDGLQERSDATSGPIHFIPEGLSACQIVGELINSKLHYERLLERIRDGIVHANEAGQVVYTNSAATRLLERDELELIGSQFGETIEPKNREKIERALRSFAGEGSRQPKTLLVSNGNKVLRFHIDCVHGPFDTPIYVIVIEDLSFLKSFIEI